MIDSATEERLRGALQRRGAFLNGHFRLSSGLHSPRFIQKFRLLEDPALVTLAAEALLTRFDRRIAPTVVVSAAVGGIVLGYEVARQIGARAIFVEKEAGRALFRRGFAIAPEERVLVVEDVVTTGGSVREVLDLVATTGAQIEAVGAVLRRSEVIFPVPTEVLLDEPLAAYEPDLCPLCRLGVPLDDPGSRRLQSS